MVESRHIGNLATFTRSALVYSLKMDGFSDRLVVGVKGKVGALLCVIESLYSQKECKKFMRKSGIIDFCLREPLAKKR